MDFIDDSFFYDNHGDNCDEFGEDQPLLQGSEECTWCLLDHGEVAVGSKRCGDAGLKFGGVDSLSLSDFEGADDLESQVVHARRYSFSGYDLVSAILVLLIIAIVVAILAWLIIKWNHPL